MTPTPGARAAHVHVVPEREIIEDSKLREASRAELDPAFLSRRLALRNVLAHRTKSIIVGIIFALGALVVVVGNALVDAMDVGMARSIQAVFS